MLYMKIYLCSESQNSIDTYKNFFSHIPFVYYKIISRSDILTCKEFDVINVPTSFAVQFGANFMRNDCRIIETKNYKGSVDYFVTSPFFDPENKNLSTFEMAVLQFEIPLRKVAKYFYNKEISYGVHDEYSLTGYVTPNDALLSGLSIITENLIKESN